jgi:hypothetical protein
MISRQTQIALAAPATPTANVAAVIIKVYQRLALNN